MKHIDLTKIDIVVDTLFGKLVPFIEIKTSGIGLGTILNTVRNISYLKEVLEGIKNVEITREEFSRLEKEEIQRRYSYYDHMNTEERKSMLYEWGDGEVWFMESFQDVTTVQYVDVLDFEEYNTKEVLVVLEKWIVYLEEFYKYKKIIK